MLTIRNQKQTLEISIAGAKKNLFVSRFPRKVRLAPKGLLSRLAKTFGETGRIPPRRVVARSRRRKFFSSQGVGRRVLFFPLRLVTSSCFVFCFDVVTPSALRVSHASTTTTGELLLSLSLPFAASLVFYFSPRSAGSEAARFSSAKSF